MSLYIHSVSSRSLEDVSPEALIAGIAHRLAAFVDLYAPSDAPDDLDAFVGGLSVENDGPPDTFRTWRIIWEDEDDGVYLERATGKDLAAEVETLRESLDGRDEDAVDNINALLDRATDIVAAEMQPGDLDTMCWPVAIAAQVWLAERGSGLIHADEEGWFRPASDDHESVLDE